MNKSRHIPIADYYSILQLEFISFRLREITYQKKYTEKYRGYCKGKKEKIESISFRNCLPSIFTSETTRAKYLGKFFNEWGLPNFTYKDEASEKLMGRWDRYYYFAKGTSIKYESEDGVQMGVIKDNFVDDFEVAIAVGDGELKLPYNKISRVMADGFLEN